MAPVHIEFIFYLNRVQRYKMRMDNMANKELDKPYKTKCAKLFAGQSKPLCIRAVLETGRTPIIICKELQSGT